MIEKDKSPEVNYEWPDNYYMTISPEDRLSILKEHMSDAREESANNFRMKLYEKRYISDKHGKTIDNFTKAWMMMGITAEQGIGLFSGKKTKKEWLGYIDDFCLDKSICSNEEEIALLEKEWIAFFNQFIYNCSTDKTYGSTFMGLIPMKKKTISAKAAAELEHLTKTFPERLGLDEQFAPFYEIAAKVYKESTVL